MNSKIEDVCRFVVFKGVSEQTSQSSLTDSIALPPQVLNSLIEDETTRQ
jgi:hypothetical protein